MNCDSSILLSQFCIGCGLLFFTFSILFVFGIKHSSPYLFKLYLWGNFLIDAVLCAAFTLFCLEKRCEALKEFDRILVQLCVSFEILIMFIFLILAYKLRKMVLRITTLKKKVHESFNMEDLWDFATKDKKNHMIKWTKTLFYLLIILFLFMYINSRIMNFKNIEYIFDIFFFVGNIRITLLYI